MELRIFWYVKLMLSFDQVWAGPIHVTFGPSAVSW
jgi:hypothetical protein